MISYLRQQNRQKTKGFTMREERTAQISISESYAKHDIGMKLSRLSELMDIHSDVIFKILCQDLTHKTTKKTGRQGLTVESVFRCLLLKQQLRVSYEQLSFLLCDSMSYRTFARLRPGQNPSKIELTINHSPNHTRSFGKNSRCFNERMDR